MNIEAAKSMIEEACDCLDEAQRAYSKQSYNLAVIRNYAPQKIVLFGSYARGDAHEGSDIDLMLIKETHRRFIDRIGDVIELNNTMIPIEPLVYSPSEFEKMKKEKRDFIMTIEEEGIEIYTDPS